MITEKDIFKSYSEKIPVEKGCTNTSGGCFCSGECHHIVGFMVDGKFEADPNYDSTAFRKAQQNFHDLLNQKPNEKNSKSNF